MKEKRYECLNCRGLITIEQEGDEKKIKCCKFPKLELLSLESDEKPETVLRQCYEEIIDCFDRLLDAPNSTIKFCSLYIVSSYFHSEFGTFPHLSVVGMKGAAKTRLLNLIAHLTNADGQVNVGMKEAVLFREPKHKVMIIDECENIGSKEYALLREYINVCYKEGAVVKRNKKIKTASGEGYEIETFEPYKPIVLANISGMEEVLSSRAIPLILEKSNNILKIKALEDFDVNPVYKKIKRNLKLFSVVMQCSYVKKHIKLAWNDYIREKHTTNYINTNYTKLHNYTDLQEKILIEEIFEKIDNTGIDGRNLELFFPLFMIAKMLGEDVFEEFLGIAKGIVESRKESDFAENKDIALYEFISNLDVSLKYYHIKELTTKFKAWYGEEEWINEKWLGRALNRLNLILSRKRVASGKIAILDVARAKEKIKIFKSMEEIK